MDQGQKDIIRMRVISTAFTTLALAIFKPFGLDAWHWQGYMHLAVIFVLGVIVCMLTDAVMKYLVRKPISMDDSRRDVNYFIRRNLYFQVINTLLVTLMICLYRHLVMSEHIPANHLSWSNFFETLFRSRYLAEELEETKLMNEQLKATKPSPVISNPSDITLSGTTNETVTLQVSNLLYIDAVGNYVKVHHLRDGSVRVDMLRATTKQIEEELHDFPMIVRCHRAFLVNLGQVEQVIYKSGSMQLVMRLCPEAVPVSRSNISLIKEAILKRK